MDQDGMEYIPGQVPHDGPPLAGGSSDVCSLIGPPLSCLGYSRLYTISPAPDADRDSRQGSLCGGSEPMSKQGG